MRRLTFGVITGILAVFLMSAAALATEPVTVDQPAYTIVVTHTTDAKGSNAVNIRVTPKENSKLNPEFPTKLSIKAPAGFQFSADSFSGKDFAKYLEKEYEITLPYNDSAARESGDLVMDFRFGTCTVVDGHTKSCMMQNWKINFKLEAPAAK